MKHQNYETAGDENDIGALKNRHAFTEQQAEIISTCMMGGDDASRSFNQINSLSMRGHLSVAALEEALRALVYRHGSFRTVFDTSEGCFRELQDMPVNLGIRETGSPAQLLTGQLNLEAEHVFDLKNGPLFRFTLLHGRDEHILVFNLHHLIFDGWTLGLTVRELAESYNKALNGSDCSIGDRVSFLAYTKAEHAFTGSIQYARMKEYWLKKLRDYTARSPLPCDRKRPAVLTYASDYLMLVTGSETTALIRKLADECGCTMLVALASLFELFLHRISSLPKIVLGIPAAGQPVADFGELTGHCVYLLPVVSEPESDIRVRDYLLKRKQEYANDFGNRRVTYGSLIRELNPERSPEADPLIPVTFNLYRNLSDEIEMQELETGIQIHPRRYSAFDMLINIRRNKGELEIECSYRKALFDDDTVEEFLHAFSRFLDLAARHADAALNSQVFSEIPMPSSSSGSDIMDLLYTSVQADAPRLESPFSRDAGHAADAASVTTAYMFPAETTALLKALQNTVQNDDITVCTAAVLAILNRYTGQEDFHALAFHRPSVGESVLYAGRIRVSAERGFATLLHDTSEGYKQGRTMSFDPYKSTMPHKAMQNKSEGHPCDLLITAEYDRMKWEQALPAHVPPTPTLAFRFLFDGDSVALRLEIATVHALAPDPQEFCMHTGRLLHDLLANPATAIELGRMTNHAEEEKLIYGLNQTETPFRSDLTLSDLFREQLRLHPGNPAICDGIKTYTYAELDRLTDNIAARLFPLLKAEDVYVAVHLERSCMLVACLLAVHKTGKAYLPVPPSLPAERKSVMLHSVPCSVIITAPESMAGLQTALKDFQFFFPEQNTESAEVSFNAQPVSPSDTAYIIFTSGSTGVPKGVHVRHRSVVNLIDWVNRTMQVKDTDKMLGTASIGFDLSVYDVFGILAAGACLRIARDEELSEPRTLLSIIRDEGVTCWNSAPAVMQQLIPFLRSAPAGSSGDLRLALLSGDWIPLSMPADLRQAFPGIRVMALGGATEACVWSNYFEAAETDPAWKSIPYGRPIQNARYYILDKALQPVPPRVGGDLYIGGEVLAGGYNDPALTAAKFIPDPYTAGCVMYKTGDRAAWFADGNMEFLGRSDHQVKIRGYRIEPGDIEHALMECPGVEQAVVIPQTGKDGQKFLAAFILSHHAVSRQTLGSFAAKKLPAYMIPDRMVITDRFPVTANGKTDRSKLMLPEEEEGPEDNAALSETEQIVADVFSEVLGCRILSRNDHFFRRGGYSLLAITAIVKLEKKTGITLSMSVVFTHTTVARLAEYIDKNSRHEWKYIVPVRTGGSKPPLYLVHGAGLGIMVFGDLAKELSPEQPVYGIQAMGLACDEEPLSDIEEIAAVYVEELLRHHPAGPYQLAGFSSGSVIAFEMALQLREAGREVSFLGNFDFSLENMKQDIPKSEKLRRLIPEFLPRQMHVLKSVLHHPAESLQFQRKFLNLRMGGILRRLGGKVPVKQHEGMDRIEKLMEKYQQAFNRYRPKPYDGSMDLFNSRIKMYYLHDPVCLGWKPFVKDIRIHPVAGDHDHMILYPYSISFAATLQSVLDRKG